MFGLICSWEGLQQDQPCNNVEAGGMSALRTATLAEGTQHPRGRHTYGAARGPRLVDAGSQ